MDGTKTYHRRLAIDAQRRALLSEHSSGSEMRPPSRNTVRPEINEPGGEIVVYAASHTRTTQNNTDEQHITMPEVVLLTGLAVLYTLMGDARSALIFCLAALIGLYQFNHSSR